jgi:quinoprotein glucose dehydrogenase
VTALKLKLLDAVDERLELATAAGVPQLCSAVYWLMPRAFLPVVLLAASWANGLAQKAPVSGWPVYGGNLAGQHYAAARQIDRTNVDKLQVAWVAHTHTFDKPSASSSARASFEDTPVLWNGMLFVSTPFDEVLALDAATGKVRWTFDPQVDRDAPVNIVTSRGVSLWHAKHRLAGVCGRDRVLIATLDRRLIARDATTGAACPGFGTAGTVDLSQGIVTAWKSFYSFTSPPTVVGDTIVLGSSIADNHITFAASGAVRGFDALTGRQLWSWDPVRWTGGPHPSAGSGNAWAPMSGDAEHDLVFVPTGSASTDFYGGQRLGDNRDADSLVALRASTGQRVWGFQLVHHDLWDYDTPSEPLLFNFRGLIPAVAITTKTSMVFVFNRLTGEPLYPVQERTVPPSTLPGEVAWPTQPFSTLPTLTPLQMSIGDVHLTDPADQKFCRDALAHLDNHGLFTPPSKNGSLVYPGSLGGSNWGSSAFDPATGILYTRVSNLPCVVREERKPPPRGSFSSRLERRWLEDAPEWAGGSPPRLSARFKSPDSGGDESDEKEQVGTPYKLARQGLLAPSGAPCAPQPFGSIVALNLDTGRLVWSAAHGEMTKGYPGSIGDGGVIATGGGLVFGASTNDALLRAYDSATGKQLWQGPLAAVAEATPMSYIVNGRQYVVIAAGGHGFIGTGRSDEVIAFALPEKAKPAKRSKLR